MSKHMKPKVVIHIETSLDGKVTGFEANMSAYYQLAEQFDADVMLSGSNTILAADMPDPVPEWCFQAASQYPSCDRMIMAIVDSTGKVRNWAAIKKQPFWKLPLALVSESTPGEYIEYLKSENVDYIMAGKEKVDLKKALSEMVNQYAVKTVRIDSGGTLTTLMLAQGLVNEISLLINPGIVGNLSEQRFIEDADLNIKKPVALDLQHAERVEEGYVWLRYKVV